MKRLVCLLFVFVCLLSACSPHTKRPMDDAHYKYGKKALEIADKFLDFELSAEDAYRQISALTDSESALPDYNGAGENKSGDISVEVKVSSLKLAFFYAHFYKDASDVLSARNDLAELLGEAVR